MERPENNKWLDEALTEIVGSKKPTADFEQWKQQHPDAVQMLTSRATGSKVSKRPLSIGNIIMKSPITKLAAAAVLIVAVLLSITFMDKTVAPANAELAKIFKNSTDKEWLYVVKTKYEGIKNNDGWIWVEAQDSRQVEKWYSIHPFQEFERLKDGHISLEDYANRRVYSYDPDSKTVTIEYDDAPDLAQEYRIQSLRDAIALSVPKDDKIIKRQEVVNGKTLNVFYKIVPDEGYEQWFVDPETQLVIKNEEVEYEDKGKVVTIFSYPETGPADIYELGVQRDVKVVVNTPPREIEEPVNKARAAEKRFSNMFFSIECKVLESFKDSIPLIRLPGTYMPFQKDTRVYITDNLNKDNNIAPAVVITVTYRKGDNGRRDIYPVWISGYSDLEDYQKQLEEIKKTIPAGNKEALKSWAQRRLPSQIIIFNNRDMSVFQLKHDGTLTKLSPRLDPRDRAALLNINFWRPGNNRYDLDHYCQLLPNQRSNWGNLIGIVIGGAKYHCYYNPDRDYICERTIKGFDEFDQSYGYTKDVLEYANTSSGHWYPKKTLSVRDNASYLFLNYIDDNCLIDDELFDISTISASSLTTFDSE